MGWDVCEIEYYVHCLCVVVVFVLPEDDADDDDDDGSIREFPQLLAVTLTRLFFPFRMAFVRRCLPKQRMIPFLSPTLNVVRLSLSLSPPRVGVLVSALD